MAWFDILKNQALVSQLGSTMDWENEEVPDEEEEDNDCIKKLMEIYERATNYTQRLPTKNKKTVVRTFMIKKETNNKLSETKVCEVLDTFKNANDEFYRRFNDSGFYYSIVKNMTYSDYKNNMRSTLIDINDTNSKFKFFVHVAYNILDETIQNKETQREYIDLCKKVFGEYYNSTYEEVFGDS